MGCIDDRNISQAKVYSGDEVAAPVWSELNLRIAEGTSFFNLDDRPVVFSEANQNLYGLNETAAYIWCCLEERRPLSAIASELAETGIPTHVAKAHMEEALRAWLHIGLLKINHFDNELFAARHSFTVSLGPLRITIRASNRDLQLRLNSLFSGQFEPAHTVEPAHIQEEIFHVTEMSGLSCVFHNGVNVICCELDELAPSLKAYLAEQIIMVKLPNVLFHAACVERGGKLILVSGSPGAGKTTLTAYLLHKGFQYCSDDIVAIGPNGFIEGMPFAPTVKLDKSNILDGIRPDLKDAVIHIRPDGKRVRYLESERLASGAKYDVGWIIFIDRKPDCPIGLNPLSRLEAFRRLVEGSYSADNRLTISAFGAIRKILTSADSFELSYSNAAEAADMMVGLCDARV